MGTPTLNIDEIEIPRTPAVLYQWCKDRIDEIAAGSDGAHLLRMRRGLCKELVEEVFPIAIWANGTSHLSEDALVTPKVGSQSYDATVVDSNVEPSLYYLEVTQAHMGQSEHFRMLHLEREGWSPGPLSEVRRIGTRNKGTIMPGRILNSMSGNIQKTEELILDAIEKKLGKDYPPFTRLLVAFDDFVIRNEPSVSQRLRGAIDQLLDQNSCSFVKIDLVGMTENLLLSYAVEN